MVNVGEETTQHKTNKQTKKIQTKKQTTTEKFPVSHRASHFAKVYCISHFTNFVLALSRSISLTFSATGMAIIKAKCLEWGILLFGWFSSSPLGQVTLLRPWSCKDLDTCSALCTVISMGLLIGHTLSICMNLCWTEGNQEPSISMEGSWDSSVPHMMRHRRDKYMGPNSS